MTRPIRLKTTHRRVQMEEVRPGDIFRHRTTGRLVFVSGVRFSPRGAVMVSSRDVGSALADLVEARWPLAQFLAERDRVNLMESRDG